MLDQDIPVHLVHINTIPGQDLADFVTAVEAAELPVSVLVTDPPGPMALVEWYIPTAAVVYLAKSYFDGFLKEAGKDHYLALKKGVGTLWSTFFGDARAVRIQILSSSPKKVTSTEYSLGLSVMAYAGERRHFKLLLDEDISQDDLEAAVATFLRFVAHFHNGKLEEAQQEQLRNLAGTGSMIVVSYSRQDEQIIVMDTRPGPPSSKQTDS